MLYTERMIRESKEQIGRLIQSDATPKKYARPLLEALEIINQQGKTIRSLVELHEAWHTWHRVEDKLPQPYRIVLVCNKRGEVSTGYHNGAGEWIDAQVDPAWWMTVPAVPKEVET